MARVRMFCDWDNDSADLVRRLSAQTDGFEGNDYRGINFVTDDSYTHAICFNFPDHPLLSDPANNVALILEPPELIKSMFGHQKSKKYDNVRMIYSFASDIYEPAYGIGFATVPDLEYPPLLEKPNQICMITSDKLMTPYHQKRQTIRNALLKTDLPIDFYGRGLAKSDDPRVKGEIPPMSKYQVLSQYRMCIDFENSPHSAVTDKFFDPVLCNNIPVTNAAILHTLCDMDSFFYVSFDMSISDIVADIEEIIDTPLNRGHEEALWATRESIRSGEMSLAEWIFARIRETL